MCINDFFSHQALTEIDGMLKYLDKAENEINTAEPVNVEPETLNIQLHDHQVHNFFIFNANKWCVQC